MYPQTLVPEDMLIKEEPNSSAQQHSVRRGSLTEKMSIRTGRYTDHLQTLEILVLLQNADTTVTLFI